MTKPPFYRASMGLDYRCVPIKNNSCQQYPVACTFLGKTSTGKYVCMERDIHGRLPCLDRPIIFLSEENYLKHRLMGEI